MQPILIDLEPPHPLAASLCAGLPAEQGELIWRHFPDGESYLRVDTKVSGRQVLLLANLAYPDSKFLPLCFLTDTLRELGASSVALIAPYLCYMRQDTRFQPGEAVTSRTFARLLSRQFDWLVTVDPHLHRVTTLSEIYSIPTRVLHAAPLLAHWLADRAALLLVGPDGESEQWVSEIAFYSGHPYVIGQKRRHGDRDVQITLPDLADYRDRTAVIIDDIVSSGQTLLQCVDALHSRNITRIDCAAVHGIFADNIDRQLHDRGVGSLITSNAIPHPSNQIDLSTVIIDAVKPLLTSPPR